jgi:RNase P/RNase MRP subunit POP5
MSRHYYLDISLLVYFSFIFSVSILQSCNLTCFFFRYRKLFDNIDYEITPEYFKNNIVVAITRLFGESTACVDIDVLKYNSRSKRAILRVPADHYVKIRSSLTLCGKYQGDSCAYIVHKASPLLLNLQGDSRDFEH